MSRKNGKVERRFSELIASEGLTVGKTVNDKNAYLTHLIQHYHGWSDFFNLWANQKFSARKKLAHVEDDGDEQLNLFPVEYDNVPFPPVPPGEEKFTFIDLFAGIGGFRIAMQEQGGRCVFSSEWDINSQRTYFANFGEIPFGDITLRSVKGEIPKQFDVLCAGFPCQPFSLAGVSKKNSLGRKHGFLDETQGTLFYDIAEILEEHHPKAFILENVKNLKSHDKGKTYLIIKETLDKLGYKVFDQVIDAKHYVPQHRERIFLVGFSKRHFKGRINFEFPDAPNETHAVKKILEAKPDPKYTLTNHLWDYLQKYAEKHRLQGNGFGFGLVDLNSHTRTLSARYHKDGSEILIPQKGKNPRRLTPNECRALMGYPPKFKIDGTGVSDTQLYRQFGNSVVVEVVYAVGQSLIKAISNQSSTNLTKSKSKIRTYAPSLH